MNKIKDALFGLCVGDALGVPVEFYSREELEKDPIIDMIGYKVWNQPPGTWSDDSSMAFCLAESLYRAGFDPQDIASRFSRWYGDGYWTPYGECFDTGSTTRAAIKKLKEHVEPTQAGGTREQNNGNGSLMRILPIAFYIKDMEIEERFDIIHQVSSITHAHPRSLISCGIYIEMAINLLRGLSRRKAYKKTVKTINEYYKKDPYKKELVHFKRILEEDISCIKRENIASSGYVVYTLEASLWCCLIHGSYRETVLEAVNLGGDTDTTGAVAGGLAGIIYGYENIPKKWIEKIPRKDDINDLAEKLKKNLEDRKTWPKTIDEAVDKILEELRPDEIETIKKVEEAKDMVYFHHGFGTTIRNSFGLWAGNKELLLECRKIQKEQDKDEFPVKDSGFIIHPDNASTIIMQALWENCEK